MAAGYTKWVLDRPLTVGLFQAFVEQLAPELGSRAGAKVGSRRGAMQLPCPLKPNTSPCLLLCRAWRCLPRPAPPLQPFVPPLWPACRYWTWHRRPGSLPSRWHARCRRRARRRLPHMACMRSGQAQPGPRALCLLCTHSVRLWVQPMLHVPRPQQSSPHPHRPPCMEPTLQQSLLPWRSSVRRGRGWPTCCASRRTRSGWRSLGTAAWMPSPAAWACSELRKDAGWEWLAAAPICAIPRKQLHACAPPTSSCTAPPPPRQRRFVPDVVAAFAAFRRVLRPGGLLAATTWQRDEAVPFFGALEELAAAVDPGGAATGAQQQQQQGEGQQQAVPEGQQAGRQQAPPSGPCRFGDPAPLLRAAEAAGFVALDCRELRLAFFLAADEWWECLCGLPDSPVKVGRSLPFDCPPCWPGTLLFGQRWHRCACSQMPWPSQPPLAARKCRRRWSGCTRLAGTWQPAGGRRSSCCGSAAGCSRTAQS